MTLGRKRKFLTASTMKRYARLEENNCQIPIGIFKKLWKVYTVFHFHLSNNYTILCKNIYPQQIKNYSNLLLNKQPNKEK